jgi:hypothetical protein
MAEDENHHNTIYTTFNVEVDGSTYKLPIQDSKYFHTKPPSHWSWNPRLMLGVSAGLRYSSSFTWGPSLGMSVGSYGQYKESPDWYFGVISFGYDPVSEKPSVAVDPAIYKISNYIPFTQSLYAGPEIGIDSQAHLLIMGGIRLGL